VLALQSLFKAVRVISSLPTFSYAPFRWIHYSELLNGVKRVAIVSDVDPLRFGCHSLCWGGCQFCGQVQRPSTLSCKEIGPVTATLSISPFLWRPSSWHHPS
jgi:hypothetical protein